MQTKQRSNVASEGSSLKLDQVNLLLERLISSNAWELMKLWKILDGLVEVAAPLRSEWNRVTLNSPIKTHGRV